MTESTKTVFEKYSVRKSKKQKNAFALFVKQTAENKGFEFKTEKGLFGAKNLVVGNPEKAKAVFTAHYDTAVRLPIPNIITPKSAFLFVMYQLLICIVLFLLAALCAFLLSSACTVICGLITSALISAKSFSEAETVRELVPVVIKISSVIGCIAPFAYLFLGFPNKHTVNDNTSGVTVLLDMINEIPDRNKDDAAFIFFDLEEAGMFGSMGYASKHRKETAGKLILNFDCVSDGNYMLFMLRKKAAKYKDVFQKVFVSEGNITAETVTEKYVYPSDQTSFPTGTAVCACNISKAGIPYIDKIHTDKDTVYSEENIEYLKNKALELIDNL